MNLVFRNQIWDLKRQTLKKQKYLAVGLNTVKTLMGGFYDDKINQVYFQGYFQTHDAVWTRWEYYRKYDYKII